MGNIAAARGTLYMLSVRPREQQVAEKPLLKLIFSKTIRFPIFNVCPGSWETVTR